MNFEIQKLNVKLNKLRLKKWKFKLRTILNLTTCWNTRTQKKGYLIQYWIYSKKKSKFYRVIFLFFRFWETRIWNRVIGSRYSTVWTTLKITSTFLLTTCFLWTSCLSTMNWRKFQIGLLGNNSLKCNWKIFRRFGLISISALLIMQIIRISIGFQA